MTTPHRYLLLLLVLTAVISPRLFAQDPAPPASFVGTWTLTAADDLQPDGARVPAYGPSPEGLLVLGADGRYSLHVVRVSRLKFASGDKRRGTPDEYKDASLGLSSHFGRYAVNAADGTIAFHIERASYPNWDGTTQVRPFTLSGDDLSYRGVAVPGGNVPISAWRRVH